MKRTMQHLFLALSLSIGGLLVVLTLLDLPAMAADQCAAPGGAGPCLATIQAAIDNAGPGDTVRVVAGTYNENVVINKNLTLLGGFDDTSLGSRTSRSSSIDGSGVGSVISITNNAVVTIDGFTITNGNATTNSGRGGGISVEEASATIRDNLIENNIASSNPAIGGFGGGIFVLNSTNPVLIDRNTIQANVAHAASTGAPFGAGGGINIYNASVVTLTNNTIVQNTGIVSGGGAFGGGIAISWPSGSGQSLTLTGNWVMSNTAGITITGSNISANGGGVAIDGDGADNETVIVQDNHLLGNVAGRQLTPAVTGFAFGGGLFVEHISNIQLVDNEVVDNVGAYQVVPGSSHHGGGGGGIRLNFVTALLQGNVISGNTANLDGDAFGGGVSVDQSAVTMSQNRILGNRQNPTASGGHGGLFAAGSTVTSTNDIFARNFNGIGGISGSTLVLINDTLANNEGQGASVNNSALLVTNTIVVNHDDGLSAYDASTFSGDYNLLQNTNNYDGSATQGPNDLISQDPLFRNAPADDLHLTDNSPAIDKGTSVGAPDVDFEGDSRPQDSGIDIGADEFKLAETYLPLILKQTAP